jgi:hypothetical protein
MNLCVDTHVSGKYTMPILMARGDAMLLRNFDIYLQVHTALKTREHINVSITVRTCLTRLITALSGCN